VAICRLTADGSHCEGCFRTLDEIANWGHADTARQRAIWAAVLQRAGLDVPSGLAAPDTDVI
jgi:predicted Fe-S protein YdhL (DUF1289 family)